MNDALITINLVVLNGEKYVRHCLTSVKDQTHPHNRIELNILDNGSVDSTKTIIKEMAGEFSDFLKFNLIENDKNLGMWPGQEKLLEHSAGEYVIILSVDVILDKDFVSNAVKAISKDEKIGAIQAKVYKYDLSDLENENYKIKTGGTIDTCGFQIFKSRRIINIGHGEKDNGPSFTKVSAGKQFDFNKEQEIFAVEGAVPVFRKNALENCRIMGQSEGSREAGIVSEIADHDMFWYAEDLDVAWRMRLFGWKQLFVPDVIAWHDRQTTKNLSRTFSDFLKIRRRLSLQKRRLEWRNIRFTIIKNDYTINILKDLPHILKREIMMLGYIIIFEPKILAEVPTFFRLLPRILKKRGQIMKRRVAGPEEMSRWFI